MVKNNYLYNNVGRGVSLHGLNGIIQSNYIQVATAAISTGGDTVYGEGLFPSNMTVSVQVLAINASPSRHWF